MKKNLKKLVPILEQNHCVREEKGEAFFLNHRDKQAPWLTLVCCCDSRIHAHLFLPEPVNEIFTVEVIGNAVKAAAGSIDYGVRILGTPLLMIAGHSDCGAVKTCLNGNDKATPEIENALQPVAEAFAEKHHRRLKDNIIRNINHQVSVALERYNPLVKEDKLLVVGAYYDFADDFGEGCGKLHIINLNGLKDREKVNAQLSAVSKAVHP